MIAALCYLPAMHRLFVATRPPRHVREQLLGLMGGIAGARWQSDEQLHVTLRFIGDVDGDVAEDIAAALASVSYPAFDATVGPIGTFDRRGNPELLWTGVGPMEPFKALHHKIDQACVRAGLEPERRAYHPHITLARLGRSAGPVQSFLETPLPAIEPFTVQSFELFESTLTPAGAVYSSVSRYPLR